MWEKEGLGKFRICQAIDFGITLVVSFRLLPLVLRGQGYWRRSSNKI